MINKDFRLLIIGFFGSPYLIQLVKNLKKKCPESHLYFWGLKPEADVCDIEYLNCYEEYGFFEFKRKFNFPVIKKIESLYQLRKLFKSFAYGKNIDYISIHFVRPLYVLIIDYLKRYSKYIVLTPWGSDVYRINKFEVFFLRWLYSSADYLTGPDDRFTQDYKRIFDVPQNKILPLCLGSESIEYFIENKKKISKEEAKKQLGIGEYYVISCGYNALPVQRHLEIIESIDKIKDQLPSNLLLLFPVTYPQNVEYVTELKKKIRECGLNGMFVEEFLSVEKLFLVRQCTDMFVHIQTSDAGSSSLKEYILLEKKVVNGTWLKLPDLEKNGCVPYYEVNNLNELSSVIIQAYNNQPRLADIEALEIIEKKQWKIVINDWIRLFTGEYKA